MAKLYFRYGAMNSGKSTGLLQTAYNYEERGQRVLLIKAGIDTKGADTIVSRLGVSRRVDLLVTPEDDVRRLVRARAVGSERPVADDRAGADDPAGADVGRRESAGEGAGVGADEGAGVGADEGAGVGADEGAGVGADEGAGERARGRRTQRVGDGGDDRPLRELVACVLVDEAQFLTPRQVDQLMELVLLDDVPVLAYGIRTDFRTLSFPGSRRLLEIAHSVEELKTICRCGRKAIFNARRVGERFVFDGDQVAIDGAGVAYESLCGSCYLAEGGSLLTA